MKQQIPNLFTLLNLFFGCIAIVFILQNGIDIVYTPEGEQFVKLKENICIGALFIYLAAAIDFLDGFVARLLKVPSEMGKQLDSLADVVSFGVAPALIIYQFLRMGYIREAEGLDAPLWVLLPAFLYACAGAYRLARFNTDHTQAYGFRGVPIPAAGLVVASLPMIYWYHNNDLVYNLLLNPWFLYAVIVLLGGLMISRLPMMALKFKDRSWKNNVHKLLLLVVAALLLLFLGWMAVPAIFMVYIVLSLVTKNIE